MIEKERRYTYLDVESLKPYEKNARTHSEEQVDKIIKSINEFGFINPVLIDANNMIIAGHGRCMAAKKMGMQKVPTLLVDDLTPEQVRAYIIADNRLAEDAGWDMDILKVELEELSDLDFDISLTGFDLGDFEVEVEQEVVEDDFKPELPEEPKAKLGDIYQLGNHRLMCGDSTSDTDLKILMKNDVADMCFTDPPYNADYSSRVDKSRRKPWGGILNDKMDFDSFDDFLVDINSSIYNNVKENGSIYECIDWKHYPQVQNQFQDAFEQKNMIVWNKNYFGLGTYYRTKHEIILFGVKWEKVGTWNAGHDEMDVWTEDREKVKNYVHPTQKPLSIPCRAIKNSSNKNDIVLDLFGGSGSTLIACEQTERKCRMMELDPKYVDVIIDRWEQFTGKKAVLLNG